MIAEYRLSGLVVADEAGVPIAVVPGSQILQLVLPQYIREDPNLAHVIDERGATELCGKLNRATLGELLDAERIKANVVPSVLPEDTLIEIAAAMASQHHPLIIVRDAQGGYHGAITLSRALAAIASAAGQDSPLVRHRLNRDLVDRVSDLSALLDEDAEEGDG